MLTWFVFKSYEKGYFIATSRTPPAGQGLRPWTAGQGGEGFCQKIKKEEKK